MTRYIWPALVFAAAFYLDNYNSNHQDSQMVMPFVTVFFPDAVNDPAAQGRASVPMAYTVAGLLLIWEVVFHVRDVRRKAAEAEAEAEAEES